MTNTFCKRIECIREGIPYKIRGKWYNEKIHVPVQTESIQIRPFRENGTYIEPMVDNIVEVIIRRAKKVVHARYTITKTRYRSIEKKVIYDFDDVFCNLEFHSIIYTIIQ